MSNHFHVLLRVPPSTLRQAQDLRTSSGQGISDQELLRRYRVLYPKPTKYQTASIAVMERDLAEGGEEAEAIRRKLLARMGDVSEYMKAVKQRFSVWYNHSHGRYGTLWAERFKSVLVEGKGNPLQTMAAYIDLNPVRAGLVDDPKDYRFCGYAEAVAGSGSSDSADLDKAAPAVRGILWIWGAHADGSLRGSLTVAEALRAHRELVFGKRAGQGGLSAEARARALKVLEQEDGRLSRSAVLRCRVRYFTDGAILGSAEYVRGFTGVWQRERGRRRPPQVHPVRGADWGDLAVIQGLRSQVFG